MSLMLSAPVARQEVHTRRLEIAAYKRADGLWDIEGQLIDVRPQPYDLLDRPRAGGEPMHDLWLRVTLDDSMTVQEAEAAMPAGAYGHCHLVTPNFAALVGLQIGPGWNKRVRERLGGTAGCTHLVEMLAQIATTAYQAVWDEQAQRLAGTDQDPGAQSIDTCYAYRVDGPLVAERWPERHRKESSGDAAD